MMDVKIRAIVLLLSMLVVLVLVQTMEAYRVDHQNLLQEEACDSMLVSYAGPIKGKTIFLEHKFLNTPLSEFGRSTIKFQNLGKLLNVKESNIFKSMSARVSCLMTMARINSDLEVSQLIDVVKELKISKKYLIIFKESLNATLLRKKAITFNVIIHHNESGEALYCAHSLKYNM